MHTSKQSLFVLLAALAFTLLAWDESVTLSTAQKKATAEWARPESVAFSHLGLVLASGSADEAELEHPANVTFLSPCAVVTIWAQDGNKSTCGVLIAPRTVLTVAHGVYGSKNAEKVVVCDIPAKAVTIHPKYKPGDFENDLAIVLLSNDIPNTASNGTFPALHEGSLLPIGTPLRIRYRAGERRATLTSIRTNLDLYGGFPSTCTHGDSGAPVYSQDKKKIVALVAGYLEWSRANVATDVLVPISGRDKAWITSITRQHAQAP